VSKYPNRKSLVSYALAIGLLGAVSSVVLAAEVIGDSILTANAVASSEPGTKTSGYEPVHGSMDHRKMSHESVDHDPKIKRAD